MKVFEKVGKENTQDCVAIALDRAAELNATIVIASYSGFAAQTLMDERKARGLAVPVVVVRGVFGFHEPGKFRMTEETTQKLEAMGARICSATHVLSGAERGLSRKFQGVYPVEIVAQSLKMLGQGTKVCVECATMALDCGLLPFAVPVVAIAGSGGGSDTCLRLTPANASDILATKIHEIYCKPNL
jgi:hypothetical protein